MAGLTTEGFVPDTLAAIKQRIESRLEQFNAGFDFSPESPDGQLIGIMSAELALVWTELLKVYQSYDPNIASGQALRNLAQLTGVRMSTANRSFVTVTLGGVTGTAVPKGSYVSTNDGFVFYTKDDVVVPASVTVIADKVGEVPVGLADPIINIDSIVTGWDTVTQTVAGTIGTNPEDEQHFRNVRNRTVMRNAQSVQESLRARVLELGIDQVRVTNNDTGSTLPDGTPSKAVQVIVGDSTVADLVLAETIFNSKGLGVLTHGNTTVTISDDLNFPHDVSFTKATAVPIFVVADITFLSTEIAGAQEGINSDLQAEVNQGVVGQDVVWSRLFPSFTRYGEAQINSLTIGRVGQAATAGNINISNTEFASLAVADITITAN